MCMAGWARGGQKRGGRQQHLLQLVTRQQRSMRVRRINAGGSCDSARGARIVARQHRHLAQGKMGVLTVWNVCQTRSGAGQSLVNPSCWAHAGDEPCKQQQS